MKVRTAEVVAVLLALTTGAAWGAGGTVTDQAVALAYTPAHWSADPSATFVGTETLPALSWLSEYGWWYRVEGDLREYPLPVPDTETYLNGKITAHWNNLDGKGFELREETQVFDQEGPSGTVWTQMVVINRNTNTFSITLFHYLDANAAGTYDNDSAALAAPRYIKITDGTSVVRYRALGATHYQVSTWPTLIDALNDGSVTELNDTGLPFGPGDVTVAYEWFTILPPDVGSAVELSASSRLPGDHVKGAYYGLTPYPALQTYDPTWSPDPYGARGVRRSQLLGNYLAWGVPPGQELIDVDDFDGTFSDSVVTRSPVTGETSIAAAPVTGAPSPPPNWKLSATGDLNHDGKADLLWRNTTSQRLTVWLMNGNAKIGAVVPSPDFAVDGNWEVAGLADFNADANLDILWYNQTSGRLVLWYMDAAVQRITGAFTTPAAVGDNNWRVAAVGDLGRGPGGTWNSPDIVWQNATSLRVVVWYMDNAGVRTSGTFTTPDNLGASTVVIGPR